MGWAEASENPEETPKKSRRNHIETTDKPQINHRKKLLDLIRAQPALSIPAMADATGLSIYSVRHYLIALKSEGRIRRVGARKTGRWEIVDAAGSGSGV